MNESHELESDQAAGAPHPRLSEKLIGQVTTERKFLHAFNRRRLHHAWLLCGQKGIGKATLAWRIAKFLLANGSTSKPGIHNSLNIELNPGLQARIRALSEPTLKLLRKQVDPKTHRVRKDITVDSVRDTAEFFGYTSPDGKPRIVIIDSVDDMNDNAANALLKILEEPPEKTYFLLISHSPYTLLATIRSRCQVLKCNLLQPSDQLRILCQPGMELVDKEASSPAILLSNGSVGNALRIVNSEGIRLYRSIVSLYDDSQKFDYARAHDEVLGSRQKETSDLAVYLVYQLLFRLVETGVLGTLDDEVFPGELGVLRKLSPTRHWASRWSNLYAEMKFKSDEYAKGNIDDYSVWPEPSGMWMDATFLNC